VVLALLRWRWSLGGREGLGPSLPMTFFHYALFPLRRKSEIKQRRTEVTVVIGRWTERGLCLTGRVRSVFSVCACLGYLIGHAARPVTTDRMHSVIEGAYRTPTRRWYCGIWSVLQRVRSLFRWSMAQA
jgi:hypothetical protein